MKAFLFKAAIAVFLGLFDVPAHAMEPLKIDSRLLQNGLKAHWIQVKSSFIGKSNESKKYFGIWRIEDALEGLRNPKAVLREYATIVDRIDFSDSLFNDLWSAAYGQSQVVPLFSIKLSIDQNDYISLFDGFLFVAVSGEYEFWILSDDGYQFNLSGASEKFEMSDANLEPLHPRTWFSKKVKLNKGFYALNLVSFDHLEASVIRLAWRSPKLLSLSPRVIGSRNLFHLK